MNNYLNSSPKVASPNFEASTRSPQGLTTFENAPVLKPGNFQSVDSIIRRSTPEVKLSTGSPKVVVKASSPNKVKLSIKTAPSAPKQAAKKVNAAVKALVKTVTKVTPKVTPKLTPKVKAEVKAVAKVLAKKSSPSRSSPAKPNAPKKVTPSTPKKSTPVTPKTKQQVKAVVKKITKVTPKVTTPVVKAVKKVAQALNNANKVTNPVKAVASKGTPKTIVQLKTASRIEVVKRASSPVKEIKVTTVIGSMPTVTITSKNKKSAPTVGISKPPEVATPKVTVRDAKRNESPKVIIRPLVSSAPQPSVTVSRPTTAPLTVRAATPTKSATPSSSPITPMKMVNNVVNMVAKAANMPMTTSSRPSSPAVKSSPVAASSQGPMTVSATPSVTVPSSPKKVEKFTTGQKVGIGIGAWIGISLLLAAIVVALIYYNRYRLAANMLLTQPVTSSFN